MISCDMGYVKVKGSNSLLKAELSTIIHAVSREILTEDEINECVDIGLHTTDADIEKFTNDFTNKLKKILEILEG